ncbi:MAG: acetylglutamate kinase [Actinobacteria bacterium]|nr:acetylglutamate kinase [Actinomycetota bacterium]
MSRGIFEVREDITVLKLGGRLLEDDDFISKLAHTVIDRIREGRKTVLVHGGGTAITLLAERFGIESRFVSGLRVTDENMIDLLLMQLAGVENKRLVSKLCSLGVDAVGIGGIDGRCLIAKKMSPVNGVDVGMVGEPVKFEPGLIMSLLKSGFTPIFYGLGVSERDEILNINADQSAVALAIGIGADHLIFCSDVDGVLDANDNVISTVGNLFLKRGLDDGSIGSNMRVKIEAGLQFFDKMRTYAWIVSRKGAIQVLKGEKKSIVGTRVGDF